jgi:hypothetical protein
MNEPLGLVNVVVVVVLLVVVVVGPKQGALDLSYNLLA